MGLWHEQTAKGQLINQSGAKNIIVLKITNRFSTGSNKNTWQCKIIYN